MTGPETPGSASPRPAAQGPGGPGPAPALASTGPRTFWRAALPETIIAAIAVAATAAAGYAVAGRGSLAVVAVATGGDQPARAAQPGAPAGADVPARGRQRSRPGGARAGAVLVLPPVAAAVPAGGRPGLDVGLRGQPAWPAGAPAGHAAGRAARGQPLRTTRPPRGRCSPGTEPATTACGGGSTPLAPAPRLIPVTSRASRPGRWPVSSTDWSSCERQDPDPPTRLRGAPPRSSPRCSGRSWGTSAPWNSC